MRIKRYARKLQRYASSKKLTVNRLDCKHVGLLRRTLQSDIITWKGDTNNYLFDLNLENSGANECMKSPHGCLSSISVNLSDDGSPFSQSEGLEGLPGRKTSKARKHKTKTNNVNLLSKDILGYETRSIELYERDATLRWPQKKEK
ncbi:hypothetical protein Ddye_029111 [Dipteronia dyeriana]|uniref:Uncharacterized protein n=1 Tax=Dipteronia dyeriana TaxID=168575 RepID=A0AAD9WKA8_9ROSI|nr:hypothetical protein Ddye_029111 [Dipteronia dyeriana]